MIRNKARLVAQGYTQEEEIDYNEVFAPVVRIKAIRLFLSYASFKDFVVYQMDVKSAFPYENIKEEVYVCQPPGFEDPDFPNRVYKKKDGIFISQDKCVVEILKKFRFTEVKTASTPMETQKPLFKDESPKTTAWNEFSSTMASAIICLATNQKFNFSMYIFESMVRNLDNLSGKFLIYPRAATTASRFEAEQDSGNITKTRSKATPNESSSLETTSGGGPRCQETIGDIIAQTRVLDLEKTKTTQANEIASLKRRVKKLEKKRSSRTHKLKRLYKVGLNARVESSRDEESLGKDASKQGRINAIDAGEDITLVNIQDDTDKEMYNVGTMTALKSVKGDVIKEPNVLVNVASALTKAEVQDKGKGKNDEFDKEERLTTEKDEANVALTKEWDNIKAKIEADHELAQRLQAEEQEEFLSFKRVNTFVDLRTNLVEGSSKRTGEELEQESTKKQKVDEDKDTAELQSLMEVIPDEEDVAIDVVPLATKLPTIVDWKIHKEGKNRYFQIIRADGSLKMYLVFSQLLKSVDREDLLELYKLVKAKYG
ncbi:putative ribonuclease H-like domain-containing protein [Tanacetum coccineum]